MALKTGKVIIAKDIKLDKEYNNTLSYTEAEMLTLVNTQKVAELLSCSMLDPSKNIIETGFSYDDALKCNYLALQNPYYSNKWFFAFIDKVEFISGGNSRIYYTIDEFSTWWSYWHPKDCFVLREHVTNDTVGLHTIPEKLETGEYIGNGDIITDTNTQNYYYLINTTKLLTQSGDGSNYTNLGGVVVAGNMYVASSIESLSSLLTVAKTNDKIGEIVNVWIVPQVLVSNWDSQVNKWNGMTSPATWNVSFSKPTTIGNYSPKNKKVLCFPYQYCIMSNNNGSSNILKYEYFTGNNVQITCKGVPVVGGSFMAIPTNYKGISLNYDESLIGGKFPTLSWSEDSFTNWLTSNSVNLGVGVAQNVMQILGGSAMLMTGSGAMAGSSMIANAGLSIASQMGQVHAQSMIAPTSKGNTNGGDILTSDKKNNFVYYRMSIKEEMAKSIDEYFTRFGYQVNTIKIPNMNTRTYFNYVQIGASEDIGYSTDTARSVPPESMQIINNIFRKGVTIWKSHTHLGNYAVDNSI